MYYCRQIDGFVQLQLLFCYGRAVGSSIWRAANLGQAVGCGDYVMSLRVPALLMNMDGSSCPLLSVSTVAVIEVVVHSYSSRLIFSGLSEYVCVCDS